MASPVARGMVVAVGARGSAEGEVLGVVVQDDRLNEASPLTIIVPAVPKLDVVDASDPRAIALPPLEVEERPELIATCGALFTLPKERISKTVGRLSLDTMAKIDRALRLTLGFE
jgi:mRNA-degrading endonuclease toxin of MazEF toxin-antitoxin module